jgi:polygalacturonase
VIDPFYSTERGTLVPLFEDIVLKNVRVLTPGKITMMGTDDSHRTHVRFDGVEVDGYDPKLLRAAHARIAIGPRGLGFKPTGEDVEIDGKTGSAKPISCAGRFVPFPADTAARESGHAQSQR